MPSDLEHLRYLSAILADDEEVIREKEAEYGGSWKKRGGIGAFMMLARKWDRLELAVEACRWDIFEATEGDAREEGILDDIADLRRYLALVECEVRLRREASRP